MTTLRLKQARGQAVLEAAQREKARRDPVWFMRNVLGCQLYDKQVEMAMALRDHRRVAVVGCNGCIGAETRITNADTGEAIPVGQITSPMPVWSRTSTGVVRTMAGAPFVKGVADLYRVELADGQSFVATGEHRLLTDGGRWRFLSSLVVGSKLLSPRRSFAGGSPSCACAQSIHGPCAGRCERIAPSSQSDYQPSARCDGGLPPRAEGSGPSASPSRSGVLEHSRQSWPGGGLVSAEAHSHLCRECASRVARAPAPLFGGEEPADCAHRIAGPSWVSIPARQQSRAVLSERSLPPTPTPGYLAPWSPALAPSEDLTFIIPYHNDCTQYTIITDIRLLRRDIYYDLTVPGTHNYLAEGVFHHNSGKDFCSARLMLWWQWCYDPAITVVIGPTSRQVSDVVWKEARSAYLASRIPLGGRMFPSATRWDYDNRRYAVGVATTDELNILGYHSPNLLVILTEAHNLDQPHVDAAMRLNPSRLLMTGNAFATDGEFFQAFHEKADLYRTIEISAYDTPNIQQGEGVIPGMMTLEEVGEKARDWGEESAMYLASVLGQFPDNLEDSVVSRALVLAAIQRSLPPEGQEEATLSCDVARFGADKTVVYRRHGGQCRMVWKIQGRDTQQVAGKLKALAEDDEKVTTIIVDDTGLGGGVTDRLREERVRGGKVRVVAFNGGATARRPDRYVNAITEAWMELALAFKAGTIDIDDNRALVGQLSSRRYVLQGDRRMKLEGKEEYKKRASASPDDADALAMAYSLRPAPLAPTTHDLLGVRGDQRPNPLGLDLDDPKYSDKDR